jgi:hypothetical protein
VRSVTTRDPHFFRPPPARCSSVRSVPCVRRPPIARPPAARRGPPVRTAAHRGPPVRRPPVAVLQLAARCGPAVRRRGLLQGLPSVYSSSSSSIPAVRRRGCGFLVAAPLSAPLSACYLLGALQHKQQSID